MEVSQRQAREAESTHGWNTIPHFTGPFRLLDLPQELQDIIFHFAYTPRVPIHWIEYQEYGRIRRKKVLPKPNLSEWLPLKAIALSAAKMWMASHSYNLVRQGRLHRDDHIGVFKDVARDIGVALGHDTHFSQFIFFSLAQFKSLKLLEITIHSDALDVVLRGKSSRHERLSDEDLEYVLDVHGVGFVPDSKRVIFHAHQAKYAYDPEAAKMLSSNVERLHTLALQRVLPDPRSGKLAKLLHRDEELYWQSSITRSSIYRHSASTKLLRSIVDSAPAQHLLAFAAPLPTSPKRHSKITYIRLVCTRLAIMYGPTDAEIEIFLQQVSGLDIKTIFLQQFPGVNVKRNFLRQMRMLGEASLLVSLMYLGILFVRFVVCPLLCSLAKKVLLLARET